MGAVFFILIMVVSIGALVTIFNSFTAYNLALTKSQNAAITEDDTSLAYSGETFGAYPPSTLSNYNVATTACSTTSTATTDEGKLLYAAGMWWDFFACNAAFEYSSSFDGSTWEAATALAGVPGGYTILGSALTVEVEGTTAYFAISDIGHNQFAFGIGTLASGGTVAAPAGTITFPAGDAIAAVTDGTANNLAGPVAVAVDGAGNTWVAATSSGTAPSLTHSVNVASQTCSSTCAVNFGATVTTGDVVVLCLDWSNHAVPSTVTDTLGTVFSVAVSETVTISAVVYYSYIYMGTATSTGTDSISVTLAVSGGTVMSSAYDIAGATASGFSSSVGSSTTNTAASAVTSFTPVTGSFVIGTVEANVNTAITPPGGYTIPGGNGACNKVAPNGCSMYEANLGTAQTVPFSFGPMTGFTEAAIGIAPTPGALQVFEHEAVCTAAQGWEPAACAAGNPSNYAPTANAASATIEAPATGLATTGAILVYETGGSGAVAGPIALATQGTLASSSWTTVTPTGLSDYALSSSSAGTCGTSLCFAGLAGSSGASTGTLDFWALSFTSLTSAAASITQTTIESSTYSWQAALTISGGTMVLFDSPSSTNIQYYVSSTYGSVWSTSPITLESAETAVNGLSPAVNAFAVTWANATPDVRAAALTTVTVTNNSPFAVHLVDLYVQNPATNTLLVHWYYNSTQEFNYWVGAAGTVSIPFDFHWAASTSYLVTIGADNGVTLAVTATSLA